jgi:NitT/TauT family transport system ATP-binding protein
MEIGTSCSPSLFATAGLPDANRRGSYERRDLLPSKSAATLARWLTAIRMSCSILNDQGMSFAAADLSGMPSGANTQDGPSPREIILRFSSVSFAYGNGPPVVADANLEVDRQQFVALIGPSGCGKTTLLNMVAGFLAPTRGTIFLDGKPIAGPGADRSMVFQDDAVFPWYTVEQNVEYGLRFTTNKAERRQRVAELIELVGLTGRERAYPRELSGGMRKRVDVARGLAPRPRVLLMDEPFAALDVMTKTRLQEEFLRLWDLSEMTVFFVTHDIEEALFMSDIVVPMDTHPGRLREAVRVPFGRPRDPLLRTSPEFQDLRQRLIQTLRDTTQADPGQTP